jgi:hypothetical protein
MCIIKSLLGTDEGSPADAEPTRRVSHAEVAIEDDAIDAIVAAGEEILVKVGESVCHSDRRISMHLRQRKPPRGLLIADS